MMAPSVAEIDEGDDLSVNTPDPIDDVEWDCYEFHDGEPEEGETVDYRPSRESASLSTKTNT